MRDTGSEFLAVPGTDGREAATIGRQPVFDARRRLWGYELFCVGSGEYGVAADILSNAYVRLRQYMDSGKKVIVGFTDRGILQNLPYALPPALAVLKVGERALHEPGVVELLAELKAGGYLILVDDFSADPALSGVYPLADIVGVDAGGSVSPPALTAIAAAARPYGAALQAMRVRDAAQFVACRESGFSHFHGPFFKAPDQVAVRKLSSNEVLRFQLLRLIETDEPDIPRLAERILADVTISYRLLAYLNSAAFGLSRKIASIDHAIALLGWPNVRNWLRVVLLADMAQDKAASELVVLSAQRGMFLELLVRDHDFWGFDPAKLNLVGTFSLLDALLRMPMTEIVFNLPLDHRAKATLCREPNSEYLPLLRLAESLEEARWENVEKLAQELNLDRTKVRKAFQTSIEWAVQLEPAGSAVDQ